MTFEKRIEDYIRANYDIPGGMTFFVDGEEYGFEEWVEEYVTRLNDNTDLPYDERSHERDVYEVGEEILAIMTGWPTGSRFGDFAIEMGE